MRCPLIFSLAAGPDKVLIVNHCDDKIDDDDDANGDHKDGQWIMEVAYILFYKQGCDK